LRHRRLGERVPERVELAPRDVDRRRPAPRLGLLVEAGHVVGPHVAAAVDGVAQVRELRDQRAPARRHAVAVAQELGDDVVAVRAEVAVLVGEAAPGIGRPGADTRGVDAVPVEGQVALEDGGHELDEPVILEEVLLGVVGHLVNSPGGPSSARPLRGLRASDAPGPRRPARALSRSASLAPGGRSRAAAFLPAPHGVVSPTWIVPRSGSSTTLRRCSLRSRRPEMITSAPLVLPFGKKSICTTPSLKAWPPRTSSMTARSVSTAQRPQPVVWMLFSRASMTSSCGWPRATASPRQ